MTGAIVLVYANLAIWGGLALFWFWPQVAKAIVFAASLCVLGLVGLFMLSARAIAWLDETAARQTR